MKFYQEITLLPDADISLGFIWQNVYQQVHIALVDNKVAENQSDIAVSFPQYGNKHFPLGKKLRLFAKTQAALEQLNISGWLAKLADYVHIKSIAPVPEACTYMRFSRKSVKSDARIEKDMQQKAALWAEKSQLSLEQCLANLEQTKPQANSPLPFVYMYSQQTKQLSPQNSSKFPLFINMELVEAKEQGQFDCYGLSSKTLRGVVPNF